MATRRRTLLSSVVVAVVLLASGGLLADTHPQARRDRGPIDAAAVVDGMVGAYLFAGGDAEREARKRAIDDVVNDMNILARSIAKSRLKKSTRIADRLRIARSGNMLTVVFDKRVYSAPINGKPITVRGIHGDEVQLRHRVTNARVKQRFDGKSGGRINAFRRASPGQLKLAVRVFSDKLPKALDFELSYRKNEE